MSRRGLRGGRILTGFAFVLRFVKRPFLKQVAPLFISLAIVGALTFMLRKFEREAPRPFDRLIVEVLPELPDLAGRPAVLLVELELAHGRLEDPEMQRDALVDLAYLYHANGFLAQAESCYLGLEAFETQNPRWPYLLGVLKSDRMDKAAVATHFARSIELDPTNTLAYLRIGHAYREGGLLAEAREMYEYRQLGSPKDPWAPAYLGLLSVMDGDVERGRVLLEEARSAEPRMSVVYDLLPEVYRELGDFGAARSVREKGESLDLIEAPRDDELWFLEERCFDAGRLFGFAKEARARGEFDRALGLLQRSVELDVGNAAAVEELTRLIAQIEGALDG